jgi:hypothetical protein
MPCFVLTTMPCRPSVLDAALFDHLQRVQLSSAEPWMREAGCWEAMERLRVEVLERYFGGAGKERPRDAVLVLGPHWAEVADDLAGTLPEGGTGWNALTVAATAVIAGATLLAVVSVMRKH